MARHLRNFINADDFELFFSVVIDKKKLKKITANDKIQGFQTGIPLKEKQAINDLQSP